MEIVVFLIDNYWLEKQSTTCVEKLFSSYLSDNLCLSGLSDEFLHLNFNFTTKHIEGTDKMKIRNPFRNRIQKSIRNLEEMDSNNTDIEHKEDDFYLGFAIVYIASLFI